MKKISLFFFAATMLAACTKTTNNTTIIAPLPAFVVNGLHDVTFTNNGSYYNEVELPISVAYTDSSQEAVTLSLSAMPSGINYDTIQWVASGIPTFTTTLLMLDTSAAGAAPGTYPITLTATGASGASKSFKFNIKVLQTPSCTSSFMGKYNNCSTTCSGNYADSVYADATITNKIWFTNIRNSGIKLFATYNCQTEQLSIPSQTISGHTYNGTGSAFGGHISFNLFDNGSECNISMF